MTAVITVAFDDLINIYKFGNKFGVPLVTPNFDRLAAGGVSFDAAFASVAVCNPSRTSALSGQSPFHTGLHTTNDLQWDDVMTPSQTIVGMFRDAGWQTYGSGKVFHNANEPEARPTFDALYDHYFQVHPSLTPKLEGNPIAEPLEAGEVMLDDGNVGWAIDRLETLPWPIWQ